MKRFFVNSSLVFLALVYSTAPASAARRVPHACDSDICDPARQAYVEQAKRFACSSHRTLERKLRRLDRKRDQLARAEFILNNCSLLHAQEPFRCQHQRVVVRGKRIGVARAQADVDAIVRRFRAECARSQPNPARRRQPSQCEQDEAQSYCAANDAAQVLAALSRRCNDMRIEQGMVPLNCNGAPCQDPGRVAWVLPGSPALAAMMAEFPECSAPPSPSPTPLPTAGPVATVSSSGSGQGSNGTGSGSGPKPTPVATAVVVP